jgi:poly(3-hydroxybutyrate) depolymerase
MANWSLEEEKEALELYGATNKDISATNEIWRFFEQYVSN